MSANVGSAFSNVPRPLSGLSMNCMIERTERESFEPVMYMVFFFLSSHQAGVSAQIQSCSANFCRG